MQIRLLCSKTAGWPIFILSNFHTFPASLHALWMSLHELSQLFQRPPTRMSEVDSLPTRTSLVLHSSQMFFSSLSWDLHLLTCCCRNTMTGPHKCPKSRGNCDFSKESNDIRALLKLVLGNLGGSSHKDLECQAYNPNRWHSQKICC